MIIGDATMRFYEKLIAIALLFLLTGCLVSQIEPLQKSMKSWVGHSVEELREINERPGSYASRIDWEEKTYQLDDGHWVYVEPVREGCFIHWEVNTEGNIEGYHTEGERCY